MIREIAPCACDARPACRVVCASKRHRARLINSVRPNLSPGVDSRGVSAETKAIRSKMLLWSGDPATRDPSPFKDIVKDKVPNVSLVVDSRGVSAEAKATRSQILLCSGDPASRHRVSFEDIITDIAKDIC